MQGPEVQAGGVGVASPLPQAQAAAAAAGRVAALLVVAALVRVARLDDARDDAERRERAGARELAQDAEAARRGVLALHNRADVGPLKVELRGAVPGPKGGIVVIRDAVKIHTKGDA